jgi:uncharacterized protein (DUF2252 family)
MTKQFPQQRSLKMNTAIKPVVNLNGDNIATLFEQQRNVREAMDNLEAAMREATPHGRNFQLVSAWHQSYAMARAEHERRMLALHELRKAYDDDIAHLLEEESK